MTRIETHMKYALPVAILTIVLGHHPAYVVAIVAGILLPEVDTYAERFHRSWIVHTFLLPAVLYQVLLSAGALARFPWVEVTLHFVTLGMLGHFFNDYVYPREMDNEGADWPIRPTIWSMPWGLIWLGIAWMIQWVLYLSDSFIPWVIGL